MKLIINADDFGYSKSISDGIIEALKMDILQALQLWLIWNMQSMQLKKYQK